MPNEKATVEGTTARAILGRIRDKLKKSPVKTLKVRAPRKSTHLPAALDIEGAIAHLQERGLDQVSAEIQCGRALTSLGRHALPAVIAEIKEKRVLPYGCVPLLYDEQQRQL